MKLVREIENHKFYTVIYNTKSEAAKNSLEGYSQMFDLGCWYNINIMMNFQEDLHTS
jgi:hypothetical protein